MPVGDVERGYGGKRSNDSRRRGLRHAPHHVPHAVGGGEVEQRLAIGDRLHGGIHVGRDAVGQEHRPGLRAQRQDVARAIIFLIGARLLVLLDKVARVLVQRVTGRHAGLHVRAHVQAIDVKTRRVFHHERRRPAQAIEVVVGARVDLVRVDVGTGRALDFGARHAQEAERVVAGQRGRFVAVHDVVGHRRHARHRCGRGTQGGKREYRGHGCRYLIGSGPGAHGPHLDLRAAID